MLIDCTASVFAPFLNLRHESKAPRMPERRTLIAHQISARHPIILKPDHGQLFAALLGHAL